MPEHVLIKNRVYLYAEKGPWVTSGKSVLGALEYDQERDLVKCHECGEWFRSLAGHLGKQHGLQAKTYKQMHGLKRSSALCSEALRTARSLRLRLRPKPEGFGFNDGHRYHTSSARQKRFESANLKGACQAQTLEAIRRIAKKLGHTPSESELRKEGLHGNTVLYRLSLKRLSDVMILAGLPPVPIGGRKRYSDSQLIEMLRDFYVQHQRVPSPSDVKRGLIPLPSIIHRFGSLRAALRAAGLELAATTAGYHFGTIAVQKQVFAHQMRELNAMAAR